MFHIPQLIIDLSVMLGVAAVVTYIFRKINQPVVLGYIVAGIIVGPYTHPFFSIVDVSSVNTWAELGVIFLMFSLGLEFSFKRLAKVGVSAGGTAIIQIIFMLIIGIFVAKLIGLSHMDSLFLGCMIAISSTTIIIKALEELGLKNKKFVDLVFGILIVEDLAAILMLVALTNISLTSSVGGFDLLLAGGKLVVVIGIWFLVGIFIVPRFVKKVSQQKNNEMLVVVSIGLCLGLVALASYFNYSVALGAFIMGSIIAETPESHQIENLIQPLKDIFGAVFFVSVGMLLDPHAIVNNISSILIISLVIIFGKLISVTIGAIITGQTLPNALQTGFSMAQIGEFSFIIASLGISFKVIDNKIYPIIVTASLITTFTTPYFIRYSSNTSRYLEKNMPLSIRNKLTRYTSWFQRITVIEDKQKSLNKKTLQWLLNLIVIIAIFLIISDKFSPFIYNYIENKLIANIVAWLVAFSISSPSIWAMLNIFKIKYKRSFKNLIGKEVISLFVSRALTIIFIGILSLKFYPSPITLAITLIISILFLILFQNKMRIYYNWIENQFSSSYNTQNRSKPNMPPLYEQLAPWDAHLVEVKVPMNSFVIGRSILELNLRKRFGITIVAIGRGEQTIVSPNIKDIIYPCDTLLCFSTDQEIEIFKSELELSNINNPLTEITPEYELKRFFVNRGSYINGLSIKDAAISERFNCIIVGIERDNDRIKNPKSSHILKENDILWIVGEIKKLELFSNKI
ncbi:cation:proton antiporter [Fluviispira multicolorata]|uniref:Sodium:proton antiporter n=1 Tax=Fluviispira multicolorata TaxID=2654512 RepID=A0A833JB66_9BACT|nr:cation:proton antiporter [Fluviispira multicolorata]KAB8028110.1 sodium:proton antiporter [Fluviispira multicolorata]